MDREGELDIYIERFKEMQQLCESADLIFCDIENVMTIQDTEKKAIETWRKLAKDHGIGNRTPQQTHKKDYDLG